MHERLKWNFLIALDYYDYIDLQKCLLIDIFEYMFAIFVVNKKKNPLYDHTYVLYNCIQLLNNFVYVL